MISAKNEIYAYSFDEVLLKTKDFWHKYRANYPEYKRIFLDQALFHRFQHVEILPDVLLEIYAYLDVLKEEYNQYNKLINFYMDYFAQPFDKQILEVGVGSCPNLALSLHKLIKANNGTGSILGYDPELVVPIERLDIRKELFTTATDISNIDILIGFFPCEATELMLDKALGEQKEICLQLCSCIPEKYNNQISYTDWLNLLHEKIITNINSEYIYEYHDIHINNKPLLTLKRK